MLPTSTHSLDVALLRVLQVLLDHSFYLASKLGARKNGTLLAHTLAFFFWLNKLVKSVSRSSLLANPEESRGLGGERCAHISGICALYVSTWTVMSF